VLALGPGEKSLRILHDWDSFQSGWLRNSPLPDACPIGIRYMTIFFISGAGHIIQPTLVSCLANNVGGHYQRAGAAGAQIGIGNRKFLYTFTYFLEEGGYNWFKEKLGALLVAISLHLKHEHIRLVLELFCASRYSAD
jgi:hypothetical protein